MTNRYIVDHLNNTGTVVLNGKTYPDYHVDEVKADRGNNKPSSFACANSYTIRLSDDDMKETTETVYRKDCTEGLVEFFLDVKFPG